MFLALDFARAKIGFKLAYLLAPYLPWLTEGEPINNQNDDEDEVILFSLTSSRKAAAAAGL